MLGVLPAQAGMILNGGLDRDTVEGSTRASGDDPELRKLRMEA